MANLEQVSWLWAGVEGWNAWREGEGKGVRIDLSEADLRGAYLADAHLYRADLSKADFRGADFRGADLNGANLNLANLSRANLRSADLNGANLNLANLSRANLRGADLHGADLGSAHLHGADLSGADLSNAGFTDAYLRGANLREANLGLANLKRASLSHADLIDANLSSAHLSGAHLSGADLSGAHLGLCSLGYLDLSGARGLAEIKHSFPSTVGTDTLEKTAQGLEDAPPERRGEVETFLRGAGVEDHLIEYYRSRIGLPIEFYSAFISYSHTDKPFAQRLYADLQAKGIRCWLDEKDARLGGRILDVVNQAIRSTDRVLLCCSLASLTSPWVDRELAMAFEKEQGGEDILIPLDLDGYLFDGWDGKGRGPIVRERIAGNFVGWKQDADLYARELERVVEAMRPRGDRDGE